MCHRMKMQKRSPTKERSLSQSPNRFPLAEKRLQRIINFRLLLNHIIQKLLLLYMLVGRHKRAASVVLVDFAIPENVGAREQLFNQLQTALVIARQIISVGEVEGVNVIERWRIAAVYDF
jgi:hypothetical protein